MRWDEGALWGGVCVKCYIIHFNFHSRATSRYKRKISQSADTTRRTELPLTASPTVIPFQNGENEQCFSFPIYGRFLLRVKASRMRIDSHTHTHIHITTGGHVARPVFPWKRVDYTHLRKWPLCIRKCVIWSTQNLFQTHKPYQKIQQMYFGGFFLHAISLHSGHRHISAPHVAIFRVVITIYIYN